MWVLGNTGKPWTNLEMPVSRFPVSKIMSLLFKLFIAPCLLLEAKISLLSAHMTQKQLLIQLALLDLPAPFHYLHLEHSL